MNIQDFPSIEALNAHLRVFAEQARAAITQQRFLDAQTAIEQVLAIVPNHTVALTDLAFVKNRQQKHLEAYAHLQQALAHSEEGVDPNTYDTLVSTCCSLKRFEEGLYYAKLAVRTKLAHAANREAQALPNHAPKGLSADRTRNIISYSLFGDQLRYCEVAVLNAKLAQQIYPEWTCRFYLDDSVPNEVVERLRAERAEVVMVDEAWKSISGLFWRFAVANDPNVQCFIIRDADSLLSYKERAAVDEWLASKKWFHIMRDGIEHSELILAGMWGGYTGVFDDMLGTIQQLLAEIAVHNSTIDQVFLRHKIYPTVAQSVCVHDSRGLDPHGLPFPDYRLSDIERIPYFHIGMVDAGAKSINLTIDDPQATRVRWWLLDSQNQLICTYVSEVGEDHQVTLHLPYFYAQKIESGEYRFLNATIS